MDSQVDAVTESQRPPTASLRSYRFIEANYAPRAGGWRFPRTLGEDRPARQPSNPARQQLLDVVCRMPLFAGEFVAPTTRTGSPGSLQPANGSRIRACFHPRGRESRDITKNGYTRLFSRVADFEAAHADAGVDEHDRGEEQNSENRNPRRHRLRLHGEESENSLAGNCDGHKVPQI